MNIKIRLRALAIYIKQNIFTGKKQMAKTYVSLFLVLTIFSVGTFAWFSKKDTAYINSEPFELESSSTLNVNYLQSIYKNITIDSIKFDEASSIDGRNLYFPTTGSFSSSSVSNLKFREATVGDQNKRYIYKDFTLYGSGDTTYVYVKSFAITVKYTNNKTEVYNGSTEILFSGNYPSGFVKVSKCPLRIAFVDDSQNTPVLLDPSAMVNSHTQSFDAVSSISEDGVATTNTSASKAFSDYFYLTGQPIYTLSGREPLNATMIAWLEGSSPQADDWVGAEISVDIELESNFVKQNTVYFVDNTWGDTDINKRHWVIDPDHDCIVTMTYQDGVDHLGNPNIKTVVMKRTSNITINGESCPRWYAPIPESVVTNITFNRYAVDEENIYNAWYTRSNVMSMYKNKSVLEYGDLETTRQKSDGTRYNTYTALRGNGYSTTTKPEEVLSPCVGYWAYNDHSTSSGGSGSTGGGSSSDEYTVGFYVKFYEQWMKDDVNRYGYTEAYVQFTDGSEYKLKRNTNQNDYVEFELSGNDRIKKKAGSAIKQFYYKNPSTNDKKYHGLSAGQVLITDSGNYIFGSNSKNTFDFEQIG